MSIVALNNGRAVTRVSAMVFLPWILFFPVTMAPAADSKEKVTIGEIENVVILPWGVKMPARIDTGAKMTSLDARDIKVRKGIVTFKLRPRYGSKEFTLPVAYQRFYRSSVGREKRPVVMMEICLGSHRRKILVNLSDRTKLRFPILIGRNVLNEHFLVDVSQKNLVEPDCKGERN